MTSVTDHKNIPRGPRALEAVLKQELDDMVKVEEELQHEIRRPLVYAEQLRKENEFGEKYHKMSKSERFVVQHAACEHCVRFAGVEIEGFASFFGMCECMWKRYVARTYHPSFYDPFDMNDYFDRLANIAQHKLDHLLDRRAEATNELNNVRQILNGAAGLREKVEMEKAACSVLDDDCDASRGGTPPAGGEEQEEDAECARDLDQAGDQAQGFVDWYVEETVVCVNT